MKFRSLAIAGLLAVLASVAAPLLAEGDPAAGKNKTSMCAGLPRHSRVSRRLSRDYHVPKLGGQNPGYIVAALKAYKAGERSHRP